MATTRQRQFYDRATRWLTALASVCILAILAILIGIITYNGWEKTVLALFGYGAF